MDRAVDKLPLRRHTTRPKSPFMGEAELFEQTAGAVITCVGVGCDPRELLIGREGLGEDRAYCFSSETEAPVVLVDSIAKKGDPMLGTEHKAYEANDPT